MKTKRFAFPAALLALSLTCAAVEEKKGDADNTWDGGTILDSVDGKIYKVRMQPVDGGKKLEVRGYFGLPLLGRTQTWIRVE